MEVLPCGHVAARGDSKLCRHLQGEFSVAYVGMLRGSGLECDYCCTACDDAGVTDLMEACEGCVGRVVDGDGLLGYRGRPGIAERPEPLDPRLVLVRAPRVGELLDLAPVDDVPGRWLLLTPTHVYRWDAATREVCDGVPYTLPEPVGGDGPLGRPPQPRLHAGPGGRHAVVAVDYGRHGVLLDMVAREVVTRLDRGGYHPEQTRYPIAFVAGGLLAHGTDWNRLDLTDPATGALVTAREPTSYREGERQPDHYLDFFHGRLHASPDGRRLLEDGWAWSPVGAVRTWDAVAWRDSAWESEDGPSLRYLCWRDGWDLAACWWGTDRAVLWGIGSDEEAMVDGARIFEVDSGEEVGRFPGPCGEFFCDRDRLYAACPDGLEIWDLTTGERTGRIPDFVPRWFRRRDRVLTARHGDWLSCWRLPG